VTSAGAVAVKAPENEVLVSEASISMPDPWAETLTGSFMAQLLRKNRLPGGSPL
jgi:hypothetical protein